jgi:hypothetical protein
MAVDPQTGFYVVLGVIALVGLGAFLYAKLVLLDPPRKKDRERRP